MIAYIKTEGDYEWQNLGSSGGCLSVEDPQNHYESVPPEKVSVSLAFETKLTRDARRRLFRPYPKVPRKLKKEIKSFRRLIGLSHKRCSRLELVYTCCLLWDMAPGHDGVATPAWLTKAGWALAKGGEHERDD